VLFLPTLCLQIN